MKLSVSRPIVQTWAARLLWVGWWRVVVALSFSAAILRSGVFAQSGNALVWYALQFGPILAASAAALLSSRKPLRRIDLAILISMAAVVVFSAVSTVSSVVPGATLAQAGILALMFGFLAVTFWRRWTDARVIRGDIVLVFVLICAVQLAGLIAALVGLPFAIGFYGRFTGLLSNANYAGMLACVALPLAVYVFRACSRWLAVGGAAVAAVALVISGSRGALAAAAVGLLVLIFFLPRKKMFIAIAVLVLAGIALLLAGEFVMGGLGQAFTRESQNSDITSGRGEIYAQMIETWAESPITGYGYHATDNLAEGLSGHNTYLSTLTETGVLGAAALVALLGCVIVAGPWRRSERVLFGAVVAIAVMETTESAAFGWGGPTALISWMLVLAFAAFGRLRPVQQAPEQPENQAHDSPITP